MKGRHALALAAALTALALPAAAHADSIVFIKDANVWLTSPDGAKQYPVTFDGGYSSPSQSDDGTIAALHGKQIVRMDRSGRLLNAPIDGMGSSPPIDGDTTFYGPYEPRISPDGRRIAYWFGQYSQYYDYGCYCYLWDTTSRSTWTWVDHFTDPTTESSYTSDAEQPEWITNDRLLVTHDFFMNGWTWKLDTAHAGDGDAAQFWFGLRDNDGYAFQFGDAALSRSGTKLAMTDAGDANTNTRLWLASVSGPAWVGDPPYDNDYLGNSAVPQPQLKCSKELGVVWNPTWSPDSQSLAFSVPDGIHVYQVPDGIDCAAVTDRLLIPGGSEPAFGPADVDMSQAPSPPGAAPAAPTGPAPATALKLSGLKLSPRAFHAARHGKAIIARARGTKVRFRLSAPARLTLTVVRADGHKIRGRISTAAKPGVNTLRFMGRIAGRTLHAGRYRLRISAAPLAGGPARRTSAAFRIVR
jgi:hypothetical protein